MATAFSNQTNHGRARPEALLEEGAAQGRGLLKIFLGAAPGVGKTYEMLTNAHARRREGVDVVVGVAETHGRAETMALIEGLEIVPPRIVDYRGRTVAEMDIDAILARRPALVLVDELAHTNAPGSRHPKRFLDIEELLGAGIDVYTTLNIQHVEGLNDVVARITRIRVRETVPDRLIDRADAIEVVDLTPDDLIQRLKDGKVYVPKNAERALQHYFSAGNLTALRELALRRTAQRVDEQLLTHMRAHAIAGPWAAGERVVVCVSEDRRSAEHVRHAKRLADRLRAPWTALWVEGGRGLQLSETERDRIAETMRIAERLGAEVQAIPAAERRIADDVLAWARENNITQIVIGKSSRSRLFELIRGSVVHDLVRRAGDISVYVIAGAPVAPSKPAPIAEQPGAARQHLVGFAFASAGALLALVLARLLEPLIGLESVDLVFLTSIILTAIRFGLWPSLWAVVLSSFAYNFFFLPPLYTLSIAEPTNVAALLFFTLVAVIVSNLAARARLQALSARMRTRATEALYSFSRKLASCGKLDDVLWAMAYQIASMLKVRVVVLLPSGAALAVRAGYPPEDTLDDADLAAARWAFASEEPAGRGADTLPGAKRLFLPMRTGRGSIGVIGLDADLEGPILTREQRRLFDALADQGALAIERVRLVEDLDRAERAAETDRLRQALLTSISHDLKTPLASILGAASALRDLDADLGAADKSELVGTLVDEAERLNRFIANLLDMTRLEAGAVVPNFALHDIADMVGSVLRRAAKILSDHRVDVYLPDDLPLVNVDAVLFEQVVFNLLDNAAKYAKIGSAIDIEAWRDIDTLRLQVLDEGAGFTADEAERIFDKFYRARKTDQIRAGTGLGLAIARGFMEAMGGSIGAANRTDRAGAVFTLRLPVPEQPDRPDTAA